MADISGGTLMMAIQAVEAQLRRLQARIDGAGDDDDVSDDEEMLMAYDACARELRSAYDIARSVQSNLPPYSKLVKGG